MTSNPGKAVTRYQFSDLFRCAWEKSMNMTNIVPGFRTTGIFPLNPMAVSVSSVSGDVGSTEKRRVSLVERTGLQFIPLYSPSKQITQPKPQGVTFESEEMVLYQKRYEEGYEIPDSRWVKMYHTESLHPEACTITDTQ